MSRLELTRRQLLQAGGVVMVSSLLPAPLSAFAAESVASPADLPLDRVDSFISLTADGRVTAFNGHVDLGTGIRTALAQIVVLTALAAKAFELPAEKLTAAAGQVFVTRNPGRSLSYAQLASGQNLHVMLDKNVQLNSERQNHYVGRAVPRVDIPAK
ncbi:aldehyde dehydrogenase, partial [Serratia marcescens]